jgi:hypothetical protein
MVPYNAISSGPLGPVGPPRVLRTARTTSGSYVATVRYTVAVHKRRMGHYGIHAGSRKLLWTGVGYNIPTIIYYYHIQVKYGWGYLYPTGTCIAIL